MPFTVSRFLDANGAPLAGGLVYTYAAGTNTPMASYTDSTALVQNTNPVVLDSTGSGNIWISGNYKINLKDANGVQQPNYPVDNVADFHTIDNITATSTTSLSISTTTATRTFTTQTDKFFTIGLPVFIVANGSITNNMYGQVTSYIGNQLVVGILSGAGSGTFASWTISLSGPPGPTGSTGGSGAGSGDMIGADNLAVGAGGVASASISRTNLGLGSSATHDTGTSASQVVLLDGSAKLPAVDGSQLTNLPTPAGVPVVTSGAAGKIVMGAVTVQWGSGNTATGTFAYGTAFSATPYAVVATSQVADALIYIDGTPTKNSFTCRGTSNQGLAGSTVNVAFSWTAIGPT